MKKIFILSYTLILINVCYSQTNINSGNVSGVWGKSKSPYHVFGNITITNGQTLTIEKGVKVEFQGHYQLNVQGRILAVGDKSDSVVFTCKDTTIRWGGIRFDDTPSTNDTSKLSYCVVKYSLTLLNPPGSNSLNAWGGGILIKTSKLLISNSTIWNNKAYGGGGIFCSESSPTIKNTKIINNYGEKNGGLSIAGGNPQVIGCVISNNYGTENGGLYVSPNSSGLFLNNTIVNNSSLDSTSPAVTIQGYPTILNTICYYNKPAYIMVDSPQPVFINCDLEAGLAIVENFETRSFRLLSIGVFDNNCFLATPFFENYTKDDYRLAASPCINKGNTTFNYDAYYYSADLDGNPRIYNDSDGSIDIGAYEYQGKTPNRMPYIRKMEDQYFLKNRKSNLTIRYFDPDPQAICTFSIQTKNSHVNANILRANDSIIVAEIDPEKNWSGEFYLYVNINDNTNSSNSISNDSIKIYVSNRFKGEINTDYVFHDTIQIIGDITVTDSGSLLIEPGVFIEFQDFYKIVVFGKLNILGTKENKVILSVSDTSVYLKYDIWVKRGWAGIVFKGINSKDTLVVKNCIIKHTGIDKYLNQTNGTISIEDSKNIYFYNCVFEDNFNLSWENQNCGIYANNSQNIQIKNCVFTAGLAVERLGTYVNAIGSDVVIDSCTFHETYTESDRFNWDCVYGSNSNLRITNSEFSHNNCWRYLISSHSGSLLVENCIMKDNGCSGIEVMTNSSIIRNNIIINNVIAIKCDGATAKIINNLIACNKIKCGCSDIRGIVDLYFSGETLIVNNTIVNNYQDSKGRVVYTAYGTPTIVNNIFWNNINEGVQWYNGEGLGIPDPIIKNNAIPGVNDNLNFNLDPSFRLNDTLDFQLLNNSLCINKGLPDTTGSYLPLYDLSGKTRIDPFYNTLDLGAYEYHTSSGVIISASNKSEIFPNPTNSSLYFSEEFNSLSYSIYSLDGKIEQSGTITNNSINVKNLSNKSYLLRINLNNSYLKTLFIKY